MRRLVTRFCEARLVGVERPDRGVEVADQVREVVRLGAEERLVDQRRVLEGAGRGLVELPEALGAAVLDQRVAELLEEDLEVARGRPDWSVVRTWSSCTEADVWVTGKMWSVGASGDSGLPGLHVDEQVALEEQARAQLEGRVLLDRQALVVDLHRHDRRLLARSRRRCGRLRWRSRGPAAVDVAAGGSSLVSGSTLGDLADVRRRRSAPASSAGCSAPVVNTALTS